LTDDRVKQVKEANDIVDVVGGYVALRQAGATYKGLCPFHDDHRPSFDVDPRRQRYRCWSCEKSGDVISFIQERERVSFLEALEMLARRANIQWEHRGPASRQPSRAPLLEAVAWAAGKYQECYLHEPLAEEARRYLGERKLLGPTLRRFGVGYAPSTGDWLVRQAVADGVLAEHLETAGLIAKRTQAAGYYDRFRDRILFPIRDPLGRPVGFGGRILPNSPLAERGPKYYNSPDTPLFQKSELLFGLDMARTAANAEGYVAVVEGYTDVLMAHQCGVGQVVATMGTALTARHVHGLIRVLSGSGVPRVVLVFDADAGGETGVDRALEIFASQEVDLAIATLPQGLDPCDLLSREGGVQQFRSLLANAVDALDFKLGRVLAGATGVTGLEGQRRAVDAVLGVIALAPEMTGQAGAVKRELIVTRIARRLTLKEETVWARLEELRSGRRKAEERDAQASSRLAAAEPVSSSSGEEIRLTGLTGAVGPVSQTQSGQARPAPEERQLLEILLAEPALVPEAATAVTPEDIGHPGLRQMLQGLYDLLKEQPQSPPTLDRLRVRIDNPRLGEWVMKLHDIGWLIADRPDYFRKVVEVFRQRRTRAEKQELRNQLQAAADHGTALELLRQLQDQQGL
jgi:DNA primase